MKNSSYLISDLDIWHSTTIIVPAVMTLICFICTAVSLTVSGFICLRDREAQDESDNRAKHHQEQEFVSKVLGLFYKIRTSNVFRIREVMLDLNEEKPVWIGTKTEIINNLEYYGVFLTQNEKKNLMNNVEVFEIDCESLFYFEMERFSKAQAVFGSNVLKYFECIQQDGSSFPREFYPDLKPIFHIDIIYNVFTEMQIFTELFVLLATGIDLEIINVHSIPPQFKHAKIGFELGKIRDLLYNYYLRVFPKERSTATVIRMLPQLPVLYEPIEEPPPTPKTETIETITEEIFEEDIEPNKSEPSPKPRPPRKGIPTSTTYQATPLVQPSVSSTERSSKPSALPHTSKTSKLPFSIGKHKLKVVNVYKTLAERVKQKPYHHEEEEEEEENEEVEPEPMTSSRQERSEPHRSSLTSLNKVDPPKSKKVIKKVTHKTKVTREKSPEPVMTQESFYEAMRFRYKAPVRRDNSTRRRGNLSTIKVLEHNPFTYMVTRVLGFLQEKGHLSDEELNNVTYAYVDNNFIV
ncbi:uncharacterized protein LOC100206144 [Hydra vulgaris]|uniref:uncharacterized protein LOC100206144 n=1 Tax=Hydra vulgaris TaxID=6087 RepID=UPI001F5E4232|nr:uncharacterized protein LOC100206144 [Hydra vulgaris]